MRHIQPEDLNRAREVEDLPMQLFDFRIGIERVPSFFLWNDSSWLLLNKRVRRAGWAAS
jgi:hypothetical protein